MSQSRKHRGYASQRIVAAYLKDNGWPYAYAIGAGEAGDDIQGVLDISVEVKARTGFNPLAAIKQMQARRREPAIPFAVLRMNGQGEACVDDWPVVLRMEDMVGLLRAAGYGDTP
jgi:hypothetical protein